MPLSYDTLHQSTLALVRSFNQNAGRFAPPCYEQLYGDIIKMRETYLDNVKQKPEKNPEANLSYLKAIDSIEYLATQLPKVNPHSPEYAQQHNILLGALYYRYLVVCRPYKEELWGQFFSFIGVINLEETALYTTLKQLLKLTITNDIDMLSINVCCRAYLDYLTTIKDCKSTRYVPESEKIEFFRKLQSQIMKSEVDSAPLAERIKYCDVIQWVDGLLCAVDVEVMGVIKSWCKVMSTQKNKFPLLQEDIMGCVSDIIPAPSSFMKVLMEYLLPNCFRFEEGAVSKFEKDLYQRFTVYKKFVLQGMYVLTLARLASKFHPHDSLMKTLNTVIEGAKEDNGTALVALDHYFKHVGLTEIPASLRCVWGSFPDLLDQLRDEIKTTEFQPDFGEEEQEKDIVFVGL